MSTLGWVITAGLGMAALALSGGLAVVLPERSFQHLVLQQYLHWHHCHRPVAAHRPVGYLILIADALHNLIGGLTIGRTACVGSWCPQV